jgi:hypothetical protein
MGKMTIVGALSLVLALPLAAAAQAPAPAPAPAQSGVQMEIKQSEIPSPKGRRPVLRPVPPSATAAQDAEAVTAELQRRQRRAEILREQTQPTVRPPWRDRDLTNGIQSQNLQKALGR